MIEIKINGSVVSVQETEPLYSGSVDTHICHFTFDTNWDRFNKSAVFRVGSRVVTAVVDEHDCCTLPWELLTRANIGLVIEAGAYGVSAAAEIRTTVWDSIGTVRDGSEIGTDAREPSAGVYEQVMAGIKRVDEKVVSYDERAQTQVQRAESAAAISQAAAESAATAFDTAMMLESALEGLKNALDNLPEGKTPVINDLSTGGAAAALSAEMGKALGRRPNPNLLHNWYFAAPVNQRGEAEYSQTSERYTVDRWYATGKTSVFINDGHVKFTNLASQANSFSQRLAVEIPAGTQLTLSVLAAEGAFYSGTFDMPEYGGSAQTAFTMLNGVNARLYPANAAGKLDRLAFYTPSGVSVELVAVKLELGSVQTLAHRDSDGHWVLNEIPDYSEELRKCQRYFQVVNAARKGDVHLLDICGKDPGTAVGTLILPVPMRTVPDVSFSGVAPQVLLSGDEFLSFTPISGIEVSGDNCDTARLRLKVTVDDPEYGFEAGKMYEINAASSGNVGQATAIYLDADL